MLCKRPKLAQFTAFDGGVLGSMFTPKAESILVTLRFSDGNKAHISEFQAYQWERVHNLSMPIDRINIDGSEECLISLGKAQTRWKPHDERLVEMIPL